MAGDCHLCGLILERLKTLHHANPEEPGFSAYSLLHHGIDEASREARDPLSNRQLDIHVAEHLREDVFIVPSCCTARTYRLASLGPAP